MALATGQYNMIKFLLLLLQTLASLCISKSSAIWLENQTDAALVDNDRRNHRRELARKRIITIGECQGSCGNKRQCAEGLTCARYNQRSLKGIGHDPNFAYCDSSKVPTNKRKNTYFCYDPYKSSKPPCPTGISLESGYTGLSCDPGAFGPTCLLVPLSPDYCGPKKIGRYNDTHYICAKYDTCPGFDNCFCFTQSFYLFDPHFKVGCTGYVELVGRSFCGIYE